MVGDFPAHCLNQILVPLFFIGRQRAPAHTLAITLLSISEIPVSIWVYLVAKLEKISNYLASCNGDCKGDRGRNQFLCHFFLHRDAVHLCTPFLRVLDLYARSSILSKYIYWHICKNILVLQHYQRMFGQIVYSCRFFCGSIAHLRSIIWCSATWLLAALSALFDLFWRICRRERFCSPCQTEFISSTLSVTSDHDFTHHLRTSYRDLGRSFASVREDFVADQTKPPKSTTPGLHTVPRWVFFNGVHFFCLYCSESLAATAARVNKNCSIASANSEKILWSENSQTTIPPSTPTTPILFFFRSSTFFVSTALSFKQMLQQM